MEALVHRGQIEALKRAEREAAERVLEASRAEPFDATRHRSAVLEWQSARIALRSVGIEVSRSEPGPVRRSRSGTPREGAGR